MPAPPLHLCLPACSFGASADHWRKNLPVLGESCQVYAIDLLGYGYSDKVRAAGPCPAGPLALLPAASCCAVFVFRLAQQPGCPAACSQPPLPASMPARRSGAAPCLPRPALHDSFTAAPSCCAVPRLQPDPRQLPPTSIYNFDTWSQQLRDFVAGVMGQPAVLVCNSVGGIAGLQVLRRRGAAQRLSLPVACGGGWFKRLGSATCHAAWLCMPQLLAAAPLARPGPAL